MEKINFTWILECALLYWDGESREQMIRLGADPIEADSGIGLYDYLKPINIKISQEKENERKALEIKLQKQKELIQENDMPKM